MAAQLVRLVQRRGLRVVTDAARRERMHRVGAHEIVRPGRHGREAIAFQDVPHLGIGQCPGPECLLRGGVAQRTPPQHLLRDPDRVARRRWRAEDPFVVVLHHLEDREPGPPAAQHLLLVRAEPLQTLLARCLSQDGAESRGEVELFQGEPGVLRQCGVEPVPVGHHRPLADLVRRVGQAVAAVESQYVADPGLVHHGGVQPFSVPGEVAAHGGRQRTELGFRTPQDDRGRRRTRGDDHQFRVDPPGTGVHAVVLGVDERVVHPVTAVVATRDLLHLVQRPDTGAVVDRAGQVVGQQGALRVEAASGHHPVAVGAPVVVDADRHGVRGPPGVVAGGGPQPTRVGHVVPALPADGDGRGDPVVPRIERVPTDRGGPHAPADAAVPLEHEAGRAWQGREVHDAASPDAVAAEHAHAVTRDEVEGAGVGRPEQIVVVEILAGQPRTAFENHHPGTPRREVVRGDRASEAASDDDDIGLFVGAHAGLPEEVVSGCIRASGRR